MLMDWAGRYHKQVASKHVASKQVANRHIDLGPEIFWIFSGLFMIFFQEFSEIFRIFYVFSNFQECS